MNNVNKNKVALTLAVMVGGVHLVWSVLVALGLAQGLIDFILAVHMIETATIVGPFDIKMAGLLVVVTAIIGYAVGYVFATVWNYLHK